MHITRRQFVKGSLAAGLGLIYAGTTSRSWGQWRHPRGRRRINGRGGSHISGFGGMKGVRVVAFCDVTGRSWTVRPPLLRRSTAKRSRRTSISARCSTTRTSTPSPSPRPTIGTRWARSGLPGGQRCLRREAVQPQHLRGTPVPGRRPQIQADRAARHAEPLQPELGPAGAAIASGKYGKLLVSRGGLQGWVGRWSIGFKPIKEPRRPGLQPLARTGARAAVP